MRAQSRDRAAPGPAPPVTPPIAARGTQTSPSAATDARLCRGSGIHYATVVARAAIEPENRLRHPSLEPLAVVAAGFGLLALLALTARARSRSRARALDRLLPWWARCSR